MTPTRRRFMTYLAKLFDLCALAASTGFTLIVFSLPKGMTLAGFMAMRIKLGNGLASPCFLLCGTTFSSSADCMFRRG